MHYLHIGRNKCASTTLQYFFLNNADVLADRGIDYFLCGSMVNEFPNWPGFRTAAEHGAHIKANPDRATLISHEALMALPNEFAHAQIEVLADAPRRVIAYIRDYGGWLRSVYWEQVMTGMTTSSFDDYFNISISTVSALSLLETWGAQAGWPNMYVRSLDPGGLYRGDVLLDCTRLLGLEDDIVQQRRAGDKNASPHWICVEIIRAIRAARTHADWLQFTRQVVYPLRPVIEAIIAEQGLEKMPAQYLTPDQSVQLTELYNRDVDALSALTGTRIAHARPSALAPRPFSPSIEHAPPAVVDALLRAVEAPNFAAQFPEATFTTIFALRGGAPH